MTTPDPTTVRSTSVSSNTPTPVQYHSEQPFHHQNHAQLIHHQHQQQQQHQQHQQPQQYPQPQPQRVPIDVHDTTTTNKKTKQRESTTLPTNTKGLHTVFIHKLYNMLEDDELKHLIWWSTSNESFIITPGEEFSRALAQYFKHTNVASFVRQLNMYGFHKVSDGNTEAADVTTWEFKHNSGSFRKGDVNGLKAIKRRSSKHSSAKNALDASLSDSEFTSERSSSTVEMPETTVDPMLNVRLAELGHSLAALRHEHARLQLRYDTTRDDLNKTNLDIVFLLDLVQRLVHSQDESSSQQTHTILAGYQSPGSHLKQDEDMASPGSVPKRSHTINEVVSDLGRLRKSILQRAAHKEQYDQFAPVSFPASYEMNNGSRPQQTQQQSAAQNIPGNQSPTAGAQPQQSPYPSPYPYPYPPQYQYQPPPPPPASSAQQQFQLQQHLQQHLQQQQQQQQHQQQQQQSQHPHQQTPHIHLAHAGAANEISQQIVHDPFHADRKSSKSSSSRSRNMSILYDPLQKAPGQSISPISTGTHRTSIPGVENGSYFPDYRAYGTGGFPRTHSPEPSNMVPKGPFPRDQRPGSFPGMIPVVHNSLRNEMVTRKRHSSNDASDFRTDMSNPPRSIPYADEPFTPSTISPFPKKSLSTTSISASSQSTNARGANSGVYALLNPERRGSLAASNVPPPLQKKPRNA